MLKKILIGIILFFAVLVIAGKILLETTGPELPDNIDRIVDEVMQSPVQNFHLGKSDTVHSSGIPIWYESIGDTSHPVVLLVMGLATPGINWPEFFVNPIVEAGYRVIRFDHRDVRLSGWVEDWNEENAYTLEDMTTDMVAIVKKLDRKVHVVGMSMGGMLSQRLALDYPEHIISVTSVASSAFMFDPELTALTPEILWQMARMELIYGDEPREQIMRRLEIVTLLRNNDGPMPVEDAKTTASHSFFSLSGARTSHPQAMERHIEAIKRSGSRLGELDDLTVPALVLHGTDDPLVLPEHGEKCAAAISECEFVRIEGMGHIITEDDVDQLLDALLVHFERAGKELLTNQ